ncbi:hypothetical protein OXPF_28400 [Oxobacter pfennigii]|uniref:DUF11 domain-containing protein n=1 Tax=Oxobacter pfennigii TaxID=36849 RepID=A0A0P8WLR2_9CLOT|nr:hypothetical protein [Oxobacter pfennigii]KPU43399.1 hypothetical protein OXPF_28400 [Oxobacter pfennigii]
MADLRRQYSTVTNENISFCPSQYGISAILPKFQTLSDGSAANNPCFDPDSGFSTWTYKFFIDYYNGESAGTISSFLLPICKDIRDINITAEERIDGWGQFNNVDFTLSTADDDFGHAPTGFQWLRIDNTPQRYKRGVSVEYRIGILGNYPAASQPLRVMTGENSIVFGNLTETAFLVPGYAEPGKLEVNKLCSLIISNNLATLHYEVTVKNIGGQTLNNVKYNDVISFNSDDLSLGTPVVVPSPPLSAIAGPGGVINISGIITSINPDGAIFSAAYDIPVSSIKLPGKLAISDIVTASAKDTSDSKSNVIHIEAVKVAGSRSYDNIINGNEITFTIGISSVGASPETFVSISDRLIIPQGVTVQFTDFGGWKAVFQDGRPVAVNTDVTNAVINISGTNIKLPSGGGVQKLIRLLIMSTSAFKSSVTITNSIQQVTGLNSSQVFMPPEGIPSSSSIDIIGVATVNNPMLK